MDSSKAEGEELLRTAEGQPLHGPCRSSGVRTQSGAAAAHPAYASWPASVVPVTETETTPEQEVQVLPRVTHLD